MLTAKQIDLGRMIALCQWERIIIIMVLTCGMPLAMHAIPFCAGPELGMRWLPMFYAPLIASICFRPHVALIVGLCAPLVNHALLGMPDDRVLPGMIFQLAALSACISFISARWQVRVWHVLPAFILVRAGSLLMFPLADGVFIDQLQHSLWIAWPGILILAVLAEVMARSVPRDIR